MSTHTVAGAHLLTELRERLADSLRELENPKLFTLARRTIARRIQMLEWEIDALAHPSGFIEEGCYASPTPHRGGERLYTGVRGTSGN